MICGMQATLYVDLLNSEVDVQSVFEEAYKDEHFGCGKKYHIALI
jgi:N-acetyl-gamma-glutamyl-phosphate reductase